MARVGADAHAIAEKLIHFMVLYEHYCERNYRGIEGLFANKVVGPILKKLPETRPNARYRRSPLRVSLISLFCCVFVVLLLYSCIYFWVLRSCLIIVPIFCQPVKCALLTFTTTYYPAITRVILADAGSDGAPQGAVQREHGTPCPTWRGRPGRGTMKGEQRRLFFPQHQSLHFVVKFDGFLVGASLCINAVQATGTR